MMKAAKAAKATKAAKAAKATKAAKAAILIILFVNMLVNIDGYMMNTHRLGSGGGRIKKAPLKLRSSNSNPVVCNEKFIYMKYLIGLRNFKKVYRIFKDTHDTDIQNILNVLNYLNNTQITNATSSDSSDSKSIYINNSHFQNNSLIINNTGSDSTGSDNDKIAKHLILSNIYIDVSTVKYIQISTRNDTLVVELDKNNADMSSVSPNNIYNLMYDIGKIETLVSSISLLLKVMNIQ